MASHAVIESGSGGVVAVGMSFGAGFALGMMAGNDTLAAVLSQPVLPMTLGTAVWIVELALRT
jgi:dienelactone hydrolase